MTRPGLAKVRGLPLVHARRRLLVHIPDAGWRELFERADILSEGSARAEPEGATWYGWTSIILRPSKEKPVAPDPAMLWAIAEQSIHLRLRAIRTAVREASVRAPGRLGRLTCDLRITLDPGGVRIDVDVQAPLIERRARSRGAP